MFRPMAFLRCTYFTKILAEHDPTLFLCLSELNLVVIVKAWFVTVRVLLLQVVCLSVCLSVLQREMELSALQLWNILFPGEHFTEWNPRCTLSKVS